MTKYFHTLKTLTRKNLPMNCVYIDSEANLNKDRLPGAELKYGPEFHYPYLMCASFVHYKNLTLLPTNKIYAEKTDKIIPRAPNFWKNSNVADYEPIKNLWYDIDQFTCSGTTTTVYAHNIDYDLNATKAIEQITKLGYRLPSPIYTKGSVYIATFVKKIDKNHRKKIVLLSSTNYFPMPLKVLAKAMGLEEKIEFSFDTGTFLQAIPYCKRDVEIVRRAMEGFRQLIDEEDLGPMKLTVASQAFATYRYKFMSEDTIKIHNNPIATELERESYVGGRTEVFKRGKFGTVEAYTMVKQTNEFYKLDFHSMYASVMKSERFPTQLKTIRKNIEPKALQRFIDNGYLVIAKVLVNTSHTSPHTPKKTKEKLIFPGGQFETTLATPDIIPLLKEGRIEKVYRVALYLGEAIFTDYVNYFYGRRLMAKAEGNKMYDQMYKTILSSLYGKFGQKSTEWLRVCDCPPDLFKVVDGSKYDSSTGTFATCHSKLMGGSHFQSNGEESEAFDSFPAIASHVTAYARQKLAVCMDISKRENIYYCDTDSLFTNIQGYINLELSGMIHDSELGTMGIEDDTLIGFKINGAKDNIVISWNEKRQCYEEYVTLKGVGKQYLITESIDIMTRERIYTTQKWPKTASLLKEDRTLPYATVPMIKRLKNMYNGGITQADGTVTPYIYSQNERVN